MVKIIRNYEYGHYFSVNIMGSLQAGMVYKFKCGQSTYWEDY